MDKTRDFQLFMTIEDEKEFCAELKKEFPNMLFLNTQPSKDGDINKRLFECVTSSKSPFFSIVNFDLISKDELSKQYEMYSDYYHFSQIGKAQIQFLRSHPDSFVKNCLQHGRIADSYNPEDEDEKKWKNKIYSILKKLGHKVYWYYMLLDGNETREIATKPKNRLVALSKAIEKYDGRNGNFMIHSRAKFVPENTKIEEIKILDIE